MGTKYDRLLWAFILHPADNDTAIDDEIELGTIHAVDKDNAYARGIAAFVSVGSSASDIAVRLLDGKRDDFPNAFFTVELVHNLDPEMTENYPYVPEAF